ncbi:MAG: endonuclease/exonuclease/phosphatase family protein [Acidobacteriota bacterium]
MRHLSRRRREQLRPSWIGPLLFFWALTLPGCGEIPGGQAPATAAGTAELSGGTLRLMTWNVEFLWDGRAPEDGDADFPWKGSPDGAAEHMERLAEVIRRESPDVVNLAEVESREALELFAESFLGDLGYRVYFVQGNDTATGQDMGLLSRLEVSTLSRDTRRGRSGRTRKGVSKHYVATLSVPTADRGSLEIGLVGLHLLARPDRENRRAPREAQADAIRRMAMDLADQRRQVIVWGDFNDFDGETLDHDGSRPITRVLEWIRGMDPDDPADDLVNVVSELPRPERYTTERRGRNARRSAIDHALVSPALAERLEAVRIPRHDPYTVSDHYPIVFELSLGPG